MFWDMIDFCMKLLEAEWEVNQQEGEEELKCYRIWQMMMAVLYSNGQLRTERDGDTEKGCQKLAVQQKAADNDVMMVMRQMTCWQEEVQQVYMVSGHISLRFNGRPPGILQVNLG